MPVPLALPERSAPGTSPVTHTRYLAIGVPNYREMVDFYGSTWGLRRTDSDSGVSFFSAIASTENYVLRVREAAQRQIELIALAVATTGDVDTMAEALARAGTRIDRDPQKLGTPGGGYGFRFFDPDGRLVEISCEVQERPARRLEPREDVPQKLSHVVFNTPDIQGMVRFYEAFLGFRISDWVENRMVFMRCQRDHHTIGFASGDHASLNHVSFEMRGLDEYMRGSGRMVRAGYRNLWGPGRHGPGDNTFSYFHAPDGFVVEYTTALLEVDEQAWVPSRWEGDGPEADQWGTAGPIDEFIPAAVGQPDPGLWLPSSL